MREGVIQFALDHTQRALRSDEWAAAATLLGWRCILRDTSLLGADPARYGGLGYGNISTRCGPRSMGRGQRAFVISGSQTAGAAEVGAADFAVVRSWRVRDNAVTCAGEVHPSSESLTHATIYDQGAHLAAVLHVHSPEIWREHRRLRLPATPANVAYGTTAMAHTTAELFSAGRVLETAAFVMLGHEDGVVAFGRTVDDAGAVLMRLLASARA